MSDELREAIASWIGRSGYVRPVGTPPDHDRAWERMKSEADGLLRDPAFRAALAARPDSPTLDVAWADAAAALPMAGWPDPLDGRWVIPTGTWSLDIRRAESGDGYFEPAVEGYWATARVESTARPFAVRGDLAPSPAEAVQSLAASVRAHLAAEAPERPAPDEDGPLAPFAIP